MIPIVHIIYNVSNCYHNLKCSPPSLLWEPPRSQARWDKFKFKKKLDIKLTLVAFWYNTFKTGEIRKQNNSKQKLVAVSLLPPKLVKVGGRIIKNRNNLKSLSRPRLDRCAAVWTSHQCLGWLSCYTIYINFISKVHCNNMYVAKNAKYWYCEHIRCWSGLALVSFSSPPFSGLFSAVEPGDVFQNHSVFFCFFLGKSLEH